MISCLGISTNHWSLGLTAISFPGVVVDMLADRKRVGEDVDATVDMRSEKRLKFDNNME